jgi:hypothetical protein
MHNWSSYRGPGSVGSQVALGPREQPSMPSGAVARWTRHVACGGDNSGQLGEEPSGPRKGRGVPGPCPREGTALARQAREGGAGRSPRPPRPGPTRLATPTPTSPPSRECEPRRPLALPLPGSLPRGHSSPSPRRSPPRRLGPPPGARAGGQAGRRAGGRARVPKPDVGSSRPARAPETPSRNDPALPAAASHLTSA